MNWISLIYSEKLCHPFKNKLVTPKQIERVRKKIAAVKRALADDKRKFGSYGDGRGLRYLPTKYFIQLGDYKGGLT